MTLRSFEELEAAVARMDPRLIRRVEVVDAAEEAAGAARVVGGGGVGGGAGGRGGRSPSSSSAASDASSALVSSPSSGDELTSSERERVDASLRGLSRGSRRVVLQELLGGRILDAVPEAGAEWRELAAGLVADDSLRMRVVDAARTSKVTANGKTMRFSALVVVGNGNGVLGYGQGKSAELPLAVRKAQQRACRNLFAVPRYNEHTVPHEVRAKHGQVRVTLYPKSAGQGIVASPVVAAILKMAGIHDAGVKIHGSRSKRNLVHCLFNAFDQLKTHEEMLAGDDRDGAENVAVVAAPPGKFARKLV